MNITDILSAASLILCCFFFLYFRGYIKRRTAAEELLAEYRTEVLRLIAEIDAATDRDALLVEERIKTLKSLLDDTDKRIAVYARELERGRSGAVLYSSLGRGIREAPGQDVRPGPPGTAPARTGTPENAAQTTSPSAPPGGAAPEHTAKAGGKRSPPPAPAAKPPLKAQIAELAAGGLPPAGIASRLGLSLSEVDLALSLLGRGTMGNEQ
ncbi:MAG: hypothetical protein LBS37_06825 [Treponema sp.]|nr:hypothetical protein [Treponema sp.]